MSGIAPESEFPCALTVSVPLPTHRLASIALQALQVDAELSPLVQRSFSLTSLDSTSNPVVPNGVVKPANGDEASSASRKAVGQDESEQLVVLKTEYRATTNRMLRVAVNGFMESLGVVLGVMEELDVDVLAGEG